MWKRLLIALASVLIAVPVLAWAWLENTATTPLDPSSTDKIVFEVPKGASASKVGFLLEKEGLLKSALVWKIYGKLHSPPSPKAGRHEISRSMSMLEIQKQLAENPLPEDIPITIVEGLRIQDVDAMLAEKGLIKPGEYSALAKKPDEFKRPAGAGGSDLEGYLYPETYMIEPNRFEVRAFIQRQLDAFREKFTTPFREEIESSGRTLHDLVIMASMLEREEPKPVMRPKVAGILYKRLDGGWPLGVDATSRYALDDWSDRKKFLAKLRDEKDPYNTRLREGLPQGPIGSPSIESLVAALRPVKSPFWYYLHDSSANIHFARNAKEHEKNRAKYNVY